MSERTTYPEDKLRADGGSNSRRSSRGMEQNEWFVGDEVLWDDNGTIRFGIIAAKGEDDLGDLVTLASDGQHYQIGVEGILGQAGGFWCAECGARLRCTGYEGTKMAGAQLFRCEHCESIGTRYFGYDETDERAGCVQPPTDELVGGRVDQLPEPHHRRRAVTEVDS